MRKPMIVLTARADQNELNRTFYDNDSYFEAVHRAGGIPVLMMCASAEDAEAAAQRFDGLLVTGGEDVDPALYRQKPDAKTVRIDADIEQSDLLLYEAFCRVHKPVLGICRGIQIINAADGGTLIQDILDSGASKMEHEQHLRKPPVPRGQTAHRVQLTPGTVLHSIFGAEYAVNSYHHQCVDQAAPSFVVAARSEDGLIEGLEKNGVLAVQWHPERLLSDSKELQIFAYLIRSSRSLQ
jgi:putative glutamine amidotransferase